MTIKFWLWRLMIVIIIFTLISSAAPVQADSPTPNKIFYGRAIAQTPIYHIIGNLITPIKSVRDLTYDPAYMESVFAFDGEIRIAGKTWYHIHPEWYKQKFTPLPLWTMYQNQYLPADHIEVLRTEDFTPIHPEVENKWIEINLEKQELTAYEGNEVILVIPVSAGRVKGWTTEGTFDVCLKMPARHMQGEDFDTNGIPWVVYFDCKKKGLAIHGAPWQTQNFGQPLSHGCVRVPYERTIILENDQVISPAEWLFRWTTPYFEYDGRNRAIWASSNNLGTLVIIHSGNLAPPGLMLQTKLKSLR